MNVQYHNDVRVLCKGELYLEVCSSLMKSLKRNRFPLVVLLYVIYDMMLYYVLLCLT